MKNKLLSVDVKTIATVAIGLIAGMFFCGIAIKDVDASEYVADANTLCLLHFNEGSGTITSDASGNSNYGELVAGAAWTAGYFGGGVKGTEVLIRGNSTLNQPLYELTVEAYINFDGNPNEWQNFLMGPQYSYNLSTLGGKFHGIIVNMYSTPVLWLDFTSNTTHISLSGWHHVALTYDSTIATAKIYIDGVEDASATFGTAGIPVGVELDPNHVVGRGCAVAIDEVRISDIARGPGDFEVTFKDLVTEVATRIAADSVLSGQIANEVVARIAADSGLSTQIASEVTARIAADSGLSIQIANEVAARIAADSGLSGQIADAVAESEVLHQMIEAILANYGQAKKAYRQ